MVDNKSFKFNCYKTFLDLLKFCDPQYYSKANFLHWFKIVNNFTHIFIYKTEQKTHKYTQAK